MFQLHSPSILPSYSGIEEEGLSSDDRKSIRLDEKGKEKKLKERLAARKKAKRGERLNEGTPGTSGDDPNSSTA